MKNRQQQILAFSIGLFTTLIILEVGLRIFGACYQNSRVTPGQPVTNRQKDSFVILCLGNSFTFGTGAPAGESYPDHLQRLFNEITKGKIVTVVNGGVGCENTAELLDKLEARIDDTKPDLIILQTGQPNWWNHYKYSNYLKRTSTDKTSFEKICYSLQDFFYKSRVCRLLSLLKYNIETEMKPRKSVDYSYRKGREYVNSENCIRAWDKDFFADEQKISKAINLFKKGIEIDPGYPKNYFFIGNIYLYQKNYAQALKWFMKAVMVNPIFRDDEENRAYERIRNMRHMYLGRHEKKIKKTIDKFIDEFKKTNPESSENFLFLSDAETKSWAKSDIIEIVKIIQRRNIKIILQDYPLSIQYHWLWKINDILRDIAVGSKIPFVENSRIFQEIIAKGAKTHEDYFVPDGHCNSKGYKLMATNVYNKTIEEKIFDISKQKMNNKKSQILAFFY